MPSIDVINYPNNPSNNNCLSTERVIWYDNIIQERLLQIIKDTRESKIRDFLGAYRLANDIMYKTEDCILIRHFLLEIVEEINNNLIKNNTPIRISDSDTTYNQFVGKNENYFKDFYSDDGALNDNKLVNHLDYLKNKITTYTSNNNLYLMPRLIESDLHEIRTSFLFYHIHI